MGQTGMNELVTLPKPCLNCVHRVSGNQSASQREMSSLWVSPQFRDPARAGGVQIECALCQKAQAKTRAQGPVQWTAPALPRTTSWTRPPQSLNSCAVTAGEVALTFHFLCPLPVLSTVLAQEKGCCPKTNPGQMEGHSWGP